MDYFEEKFIFLRDGLIDTICDGSSKVYEKHRVKEYKKLRRAVSGKKNPKPDDVEYYSRLKDNTRMEIFSHWVKLINRTVRLEIILEKMFLISAGAAIAFLVATLYIPLFITLGICALLEIIISTPLFDLINQLVNKSLMSTLKKAYQVYGGLEWIIESKGGDQKRLYRIYDPDEIRARL